MSGASNLSSGLTVVKCGGNPAVDAAAVCDDVAALVRSGRRIVLVHGGSAEISRLAQALGVPERRLTAPDGVETRYTDAATLEVLTLALAGSVKPALLSRLARAGCDAVGLTGLDAGLLTARRKTAHRAVIDGRTLVVRDDHSGRIVSVRAELIRRLLDLGMTPVISPPAADEDGRAVNVDADRAAASVAAALGARSLLLLTSAPGVLADSRDPDSVLAECAVSGDSAPPAFAGKGMAMKLVAAREALRGGVREVVVADGRVSSPISRILDGTRSGTRIVLDHHIHAGNA